MTVRQIREFGDPVLREVCEPISNLASVEALVRDLEDTCELRIGASRCRYSRQHWHRNKHAKLDPH